jgi:hypothetical protein
MPTWELWNNQGNCLQQLKVILKRFAFVAYLMMVRSEVPVARPARRRAVSIGPRTGDFDDPAGFS